MDRTFNIETMEITPEILTIVSAIDEFKGTWSVIGRLAPERLHKLLRVATIESIGSSTRIEGANLTDREVERLLLNLQIERFESRDEQEVVGYANVMSTVFENHAAIDLTENHIKQLHRDLLRHSEKDERHRGEYKTLDNHVEAFDPSGNSLGVVFQTASPFDTPRLMQELVDWTNDSLRESNLHPLLVIAVLVVVFLEVHPFQDGNGRISRILTTLLLLRAGYTYVPYSSLESVVEQSKEAYYLSLRNTQKTIRTETPDWQPWLLFFLRALEKQKSHLQQKIQRERIMQGDLPELSTKILELVQEQGRVTVAGVVAATGESRNTVKYHVSSLARNGHLVRHGSGRGVWYGLA